MQLFAPKENVALAGPWRGADLSIARRVLGVAWAFGILAVGLFAFSLAPPAGDPVAVAAYVVWFGSVGGGAVVALTPRLHVGFAGLLTIAWIELAALAVLQAASGGWSDPFYQLIGVHAVIIAACFPARVAGPFVGAALLATFVPAATGETAGRTIEVALNASVWLAACGVGLAAMRQIRAHRIELAQRAVLDELTGLGNRRGLADTFALAPGGDAVGLLGLGDVDAFKSVNDRFGHLAGDRCLRGIADALSTSLDHPGKCYRWAGDEFVVLLSASDPAELDRRRRAVEDGVHPAYTCPDGSTISVSFGWGPWNPSSDLDAAVRTADEMLLELKREPSGATSRPSVRQVNRV